jgi:hypothetical protein
VTPPAPVPSKPRGPLFWILVATGVSVAGCCFLSVAVLGLGALAGDTPTGSGGAAATSGSGPGGGTWQTAVEVARGTTLSQSLPGGRWVAQYGSNVDTVVARAGATAWVQTNSSGSLYELTFDEDRAYTWRWVSAVTMYGDRYASNSTEKGTWTLSGTQLTLQPESQTAEYSNKSGTQEKTDQDLGARRYEVLDLTMETLENAGVPRQRFPAVVVTGPKAAWDTASGSGVALTMQRLAL